MNIQTEADSHKGALFPRVHVSETKVPGPRAPPRNKMALFEQFTIPPHRFVPPRVQENSHKVNSSSGSGFIKPKQVQLGQVSSKQSDASRGKAKCETLRCSVEELCFYSETSKTSAASDSGENDCISRASKCTSELPPDSHMKKPWNCPTAESAIVYCTNGGHPSTYIRKRHSTAESGPIPSSTATGIEACDTDKLHAVVSAIAENHSNNSAGVSHGNGIANTEFLVGSAASNGRSAGISQTNEAHIVNTFLPVETVADEFIHKCSGANDTSRLVQQMVCSDRSFEVAGGTRQQEHHVDGWNSDFLPRIIPKHVIGVIGQREFWEVRKTMLQQQKTLSMQVFELHRLIEVQHLIAAMPGLLLEGKGNCFVVSSSTQPELAKVSNKLVTKESLRKEKKHRFKQKQTIVKGTKKLMKLSCGVSKTTVNDKCQNPSLQVLPLKPVSLNHTWGFIPTPFIENHWLKEGSHNYGFWKGPMSFEPPILGHWYNGHQVLQSGSYVFTDWSRPCNFLPKDIPELHNPPLDSQKLVNGNLIHHLDRASGAQASESIQIPIKTTSVLRKSSDSTLNPYSSAQHSKPQQDACTIEQRSSDCKKLASQSTKFSRCIKKSMSLAGSCEFRSERNGLGFQTFCKMVSTRGNESDTVAEPARVKDVMSVTESCNKELLQSCIAQKFDTSKVIRAVPHPASVAVQAAAKILKSIQERIT